MWEILFRLRGNIVVGDDVDLARWEIETLTGGCVSRVDATDWNRFVDAGWLLPKDLTIGRNDVGFSCRVATVDVARLFRRVSFCEWVVAVAPTGWNGQFETLPRRFARVRVVGKRVCLFFLPFNTIAEWSGVVAKRVQSPSESVALLASAVDAVVSDSSKHEHPDAHATALAHAPDTTSHLFHGTHVYKAKFFPRLARACLNACGDGVVLDPFAGSGTALLEASVMGLPSVGIDIDPLAVAIARAKTALLHAGDERIDAMIETVLSRLDGQRGENIGCACLPPFLRARVPDEVSREVETDVAVCLRALSGLPDDSPLRIALSDALARKFRFRFVGLGYARFSLSVARRPVRAMFRENLHAMLRMLALWRWLRETSGVRLAPIQVLHGDARQLPLDDASVHAIVTSPPYMPASSGRESYLRSKACALLALGMMSPDALDTLEREQIGSVAGANCPDVLPAEATELVTWLAHDPSRRVKAEPTARYFADMQRALTEMTRVLQTDGRCAVVVARRHVFYRYRTREVVRVVENADIVSRLGVRAGLHCVNAIHVELCKRNAVARPRARDTYAETILWFARPHAPA